MKEKSVLLMALFVIGVTACQYEEIQAPDEQVYTIPSFTYMGDDLGAKKGAATTLTITPEFLGAMNDELASQGLNFRILKVETYTIASVDHMGAEIYSKDIGNKQLDADFVANDVNRTWSSDNGNGITYAIDQVDAIPPFGGLTGAETTAAIERATGIWDGVPCANLGLNRNPDYDMDIGVLAWIYGMGGSPFVFADVQHAGFTDLNFADNGIIGVTFTFIFTELDGTPSDMDNNGKADVAFREIYYDPDWIWVNDPGSYEEIDLETVAAHELGHALSQAHFGTILVINNRKLKIAPRALMNPVYLEPYRHLAGTDVAGHCSIWGEWPHN